MFQSYRNTNMTLIGIKGKAGDQSPNSDSNSAVNYTFTDSSRETRK